MKGRIIVDAKRIAATVALKGRNKTADSRRRLAKCGHEFCIAKI
ncbi:MAG: hypothetical protein ACRCUY_07880 [Thermoguttaceae bacterium]